MNKLNFLVVDDDDVLRLATKNMLRVFGAENIIEASNGSKALELLQAGGAGRVDIVLCDLNMPEMDGMEFLRHLGAAHSNVSVAVISSHDSSLLSAVEKMAAAYGIYLLGAVQKPITWDHLSKLVGKHHFKKQQAPRPKLTLPEFSLHEIVQGIVARQFEPFYQPKVDFRTGHIIGAEALARWAHPRHGIIPPYAFIELLEKNHRIDDLTFLILEKAFAGCRALHDHGRTITVSVNVSLQSLSADCLADKITQAAHTAGIKPHHIILEITESAAMTDTAHSLENLARLKMRGFGLSVDDYGTGFSNIQQVTRIAFDELKIDQSFIRGCADQKELRVVAKSSVELAHKLNMKCTAEGVETRREWDILKEMGCDVAQGYFIAKPMNLHDFLIFSTTYTAAIVR